MIPQEFLFFKKDSNKTNFGGILFLIYIAIMILISLEYILEYALNEKYSIENFAVFNFSRDGNEEINLNEDIELNPYLDINVTFSDGYYYDILAVHTNLNRGIKNEFLEEKFFIQDGYPIYYYQFREEVNFTDFTISFRCFEK